MDDQGTRVGERETLRGRTSSGFWWTVGVVVVLALSRSLPEVWPLWFVEPTGQVGGEGVTLAGVLVAAGLLYGSRVARWIAIAYVGVAAFHSWQMLTITDFRKTGWLVVAALNGVAFGTLTFSPAVKTYFANDDESRAPSAA